MQACTTTWMPAFRDNLPSVQANTKLSEEYDMGAAHMILLDKDLDAKQKYNMIADIEKVDGVKQVLSLESIIGPAFPESMSRTM